MNNRYIAYFDVMGFTDFVYRNDHAKVVERLESLSAWVARFHEYNRTSSENVLGGMRLSDVQEIFARGVIFSDTVLFTTQSDSNDDLTQILVTAATFMAACLENEVPIKGALACGQFTVDRDKQIYCGKPLIDAYKLADEMKCYAAVLHHTVEERLTDNHIEKYVKRSEVHFERAKIQHYFVRPSIFLSMSDKLQRFYKSASGSPRKYVDNTVELYRDHEDFDAIFKRVFGGDADKGQPPE